MCRVGGDHLLAWSGRLEETSHHAPALCPYGDSRVLLAWTGTDTWLNITRLVAG